MRVIYRLEYCLYVQNSLQYMTWVSQICECPKFVVGVNSALKLIRKLPCKGGWMSMNWAIYNEKRSRRKRATPSLS